MSTTAKTIPMLRYVNAAAAARPGVLPVPHIKPENRTDPRLAFVEEAHRVVMPGGVLPPEQRRGLMEVARGHGLRDFEASLVIAMVQDARRRGEVWTEAPEWMPRTPVRRADRAVRLAVIAAGLGMVLLGAMIRVTLG